VFVSLVVDDGIHLIRWAIPESLHEQPSDRARHRQDALADQRLAGLGVGG
jgi:hypothetical protein